MLVILVAGVDKSLFQLVLDVLVDLDRFFLGLMGRPQLNRFRCRLPRVLAAVSPVLRIQIGHEYQLNAQERSESAYHDLSW
jgi:hypothetical protein